MPQWLITLLTIVGSVTASSGFWAFIQKRTDKNDARTKLLLAVAHDRICTLGEYYLTRGDWITEDEYENLLMFWEPYQECGGNGSAKKIMKRVENELRMVMHAPENCKHEEEKI